MRKQQRQLFRELRRQGWRCEAGRHLRLVPPDPSAPIIFMASTPSDWRAWANAVATIRRAGGRV